MSKDSIGDFLTIIRNGITLGKRYVLAPYSNMKHSVAQILVDEGFIKSVEVEHEGVKKALKVFLKYVDDESVIHEIKRLSKPSRRYYQKAKKLKPIKGKLGIAILSTNKGIMTDKRAKELSVGGEVLCSVW